MWNGDLGNQPFTTSPDSASVPAGRAGARLINDGRGVEIGLYTPPIRVEPPHSAPIPGLSNAQASVAYDCGGNGTWCTVDLQIWLTVARGERLRIAMRTGTGGAAREVFVPFSNVNPLMYRISAQGCANCRLTFSFDDGGDGRVDSWAQIFASRSRCGNRDETNTYPGGFTAPVYDAQGRVLQPAGSNR
jgi:hypothetical protein